MISSPILTTTVACSVYGPYVGHTHWVVGGQVACGSDPDDLEVYEDEPITDVVCPECLSYLQDMRLLKLSVLTSNPPARARIRAGSGAADGRLTGAPDEGRTP